LAFLVKNFKSTFLTFYFKNGQKNTFDKSLKNIFEAFVKKALFDKSFISQTQSPNMLFGGQIH
jgi:hypothetical protein